MHRLKNHKTGLFACIGGCFDRAFFLLEMWGDDLDPQTVSEALGITPTKSFRKGDERPKGSQYYRTGLWIFETGEIPLSEDDSGDRLFQKWLASLPGDKAIWRQLRQYNPQVRLVLYTDRMNAEFRLLPAAAKELSRRGLKMIVDPYLSLDDDEDE